MNQQLGAALGYGGAPPRALGADLGWLKEHLRGTNPRLPARRRDGSRRTPRTSNGCTARSAARCLGPPHRLGAWVRAAERGAPAPFAELEADNRAVARPTSGPPSTAASATGPPTNAIRGAQERHHGVVLAFQNCHRVAAFAPAAVDGAAYRAFVSPRAQLLHQSPELRDC